MPGYHLFSDEEKEDCTTKANHMKFLRDSRVKQNEKGENDGIKKDSVEEFNRYLT